MLRNHPYPIRPVSLSFLLLSLCLSAPGVGAGGREAGGAPTPAPQLSYVFGDVLKIEAAARRVLIQTGAGEVSALFDEKTEFLRVLPGQTSLKGAERITLAEVGVGDKVLARGKEAEDKKSVAARQLIVMSKAAIARKQERDREEWLRRGVSGRVAALNPEAREIKLSAPGGAGALTLVATEGTVFRRYAPDSVKFSDARPSTFADLKVGDQLRAVGEKSADGTRFTPEEVVSGSFRTVGGPVTALNVAAGEVTIKDIPTGRPLTLAISKDSLLRRIPPEVLASLARAAAGGGTAQAAGAHPAAGGDVQDRFASFPAVTVADLQVGKMILASGTAGADESRLTAVLLATGVEALFAQRQPGPARGSQSVAVGLPTGVLDGSIVVQ